MSGGLWVRRPLSCPQYTIMETEVFDPLHSVRGPPFGPDVGLHCLQMRASCELQIFFS